MAMDAVGAERSNITGIVLHVEENDVQPSEVFDFYKAHSRTIDVGRKSSQGGNEHVPGRALFRCPVVSRKHAKITFAEYGNVYIIDLHSHHGTHILRPGDFVSTALKPEIPAVLADGDLITFGKSVGRDDYLVRPIVVRVELIFGGDAPPLAPLPLPKSLNADAADEGSQPPSPSDDDHENRRSSSRPSTGRYGVFLPSPESSSSSSDGDSDIQEISPPTSPQAPGPCFTGRGSTVLAFGRTRLLQQFLPPIRFPLDIARSNDQFSLEGQGGVAEEEDMDLSSSRASPVVFEEPAIIGAWPGSPPEPNSDFDFVTLPPILKKNMNVQREVIEISDDDSAPPVQNVPVSMPVSESEDSHENRNEPLIETMDVLFGQVESIAELSAPLHHIEDDRIEVIELDNGEITFDLGPIEVQVADTCDSDLTQTELNVLRSAQDKNEAQFTAHLHQTKERLDALDDRTRATQASLAQRSDELSGVQTRLDDLGGIVSVLQERSALAERVEELVKEVGAAKDVLRETCELQRQTRMQMEAEVEAVKALRAEAAATVAEAKLANAAANAEAQTLKRKRDDDADRGTEDDPCNAEGRTQDVAPSPSPSKRRRVMRVVGAIARTATVATVGAVAAWSALAYS
ncbi:hypothetical protein C8Q80DRAFT_1222126 [Daedaleopsis nitida]|nr:hypothetical protein C8Q80DRAFT_1222126 [Daedaleopsis nitida]